MGKSILSGNWTAELGGWNLEISISDDGSLLNQCIYDQDGNIIDDTTPKGHRWVYKENELIVETPHPEADRYKATLDENTLSTSFKDGPETVDIVWRRKTDI